ncbi:MAG: NUDIX hydrolase [Muribaculaceae bacterium]|nr:NUDIX hydrolase [Muribaculaceae bacterium]
MGLNHEGFSYKYPRPALTADCVIFGFDGESLKILLIERALSPFLGMWALPGGFMRMDESIEECARRELLEETHIKDIFLEQFHCFSGVNRDPRGRIVTVAFIALVRPSDHEVMGGDDASKAVWFNADELPPLAFDHRDIVKAARIYLRDQLNLRPTAFLLLDEIFTVDELRRVYEVINGKTYDRRNFHKKLLKSEIVEEVTSSYMMEDNDYTSMIEDNGDANFIDYQQPLIKSNPEIIRSDSRGNFSQSRPSLSISRPPENRIKSTKGRPPKFFRLISRLSNPGKLGSIDSINPASDEIRNNEDESIKNLFNF